MFYSFLFIFVGLFFLCPDPAWAWGPATHLQLGSQILRDLSGLSPLLRDLIGSFPYDYLYGCISADIIIGKRYTRYENHCHNWSVGLQVLESAKTRAQKSFSYGYLSHLAADTVAHNYFIPLQMITHFQAKAMHHPYWEIRFDQLIDPEVWNITRAMAKELKDTHNPILDRVLTDTLLSFPVNKGIFNGLLLLYQARHWQKMISRLPHRIPWPLIPDEPQELMKLSMEFIMILLNETRQASLLRSDPAGRHSLKGARSFRRRLSSLNRRGQLKGERFEAVVTSLRSNLRRQILDETPPLFAPKGRTRRGSTGYDSFLTTAFEDSR